jgi:hypothetical protein
MSQSNVLLIRRVIAIFVLALSIIFLFTPSIVTSGGYGANFSEAREAETENIGRYFDLADYEPKAAILGVLGILLNVCFFGMIVFAALGVLLMLFNRSNAANVAHTCLAFLTVVIFIVYMILIKEISGMSFSPGAAMFLLPIFSLAASILYKRDMSYSGMFPVKQSAPAGQQPVYQPYVQPTVQPYAPQPEAGGWICPSCNSQNPENAKFCPGCGTPAPAPEPAFEAPSFCPFCGTKLEPGSAFCPNCGAKQN